MVREFSVPSLARSLTRLPYTAIVSSLYPIVSLLTKVLVSSDCHLTYSPSSELTEIYSMLGLFITWPTSYEALVGRAELKKG